MLQTHPELAQQRSVLYAADEMLNQTRAEALPSLDLSIGVGPETRYSRRAGIDDTRLVRRDLQLKFKKSLFDGYANQNSVERDALEVEIVRLEQLDIESNLIIDVVRAYLEISKEQALKVLLEQRLQVHQKSERKVLDRLGRGVGNRAELNQLSSLLNRVEVELIDSETRIEKAQVKIEALGGERLISPELPTKFSTGDATLEELLGRAKKQHYLIQSAQLSIEKAQAELEIARSNYYPDMNFELAKGWDRNIDGNEGASYDLSAMIKVDMNLFRGGKDRALRRKAAHELEQSRMAGEKRSREVIEGVQTAWLNLQQARRKRGILERNIWLTEELRNLSNDQFSMGKSGLIDQLNAENVLYDAERAVLNQRYLEYKYEYELCHALGCLSGLFQTGNAKVVE